MPIGDIAGEALGGIFRVIGRILFEVFFEFMLQGTGYVLIRLFRPNDEPSDTACTIVGIIFWVVVGTGGYFIYRAVTA